MYKNLDVANSFNETIRTTIIDIQISKDGKENKQLIKDYKKKIS